MERKVRVSSLILGAVFMAVAINALLGGFDDNKHSDVGLPVMAIALGIAVIAGGLSKLRSLSNANVIP